MELPTIDGGWACLYADPPWKFERYDGRLATPHRAAAEHYDVMSVEDMMTLPVRDIVAKDAALFMWIVGYRIPDALALGRAWGFEINTDAFVWIKDREGHNPTPGMGYWTRKQSETCWLFTRGKPPRLSKGVEQLIFCGRGAHSAKPEIVYERIEALVGGPRLELFARTTRPGWSSWGAEVGVRGGLFSDIGGDK